MTIYSEYEQTVIQVALAAIQQTLNTNDVMTSSEQVKDCLSIHLAREQDEWFEVMFLTSQHRLISFERLFRGTVNSSYVHIRVIARKALELNAAAVILTHNLPSGITEPSSDDQQITTRIREVLDMFDIKVLDHFIVSSGDTCSFANRGMM